MLGSGARAFKEELEYAMRKRTKKNSLTIERALQMDSNKYTASLLNGKKLKQ